MSADLRDAQGRRIPDGEERAAMVLAAGRDAGLDRSAPTARDVLFRAARQDGRVQVDAAAVDAEMERRERSGDLIAGGDVKAQLEVMHTYTPGLVLDLRDANALRDFESRMRVEAAVRDQGPGSGIAHLERGRWVGDPDVVARAERNDALRARMQEQMRARIGPFGGQVL